MRLVRSDSPEVAHCSASTEALASWGWSVLALTCIASALALLVVLTTRLFLSGHAAAWLGVPTVLALNGYVLWRGRSTRLNWVVMGCRDRVLVRLFVRRGEQVTAQQPDVIMLEASEIASMSARTVEVFLYGPKPKVVEWLVLEPAQKVSADISDHIRQLVSDIAVDPWKQAIVSDEEGRLTMKWKWCRPLLPVFLQQIARQCPSVVIAHEDRSQLDLNGIWRGISRNLDAQQRQMLVRAKNLGFGRKCRWLLSRYKYMTFKESSTYLVEIELEDAGPGNSPVPCGWRRKPRGASATDRHASRSDSQRGDKSIDSDLDSR